MMNQMMMPSYDVYSAAYGATAKPLPTQHPSERHVMAERYKTKACRNYLASGFCPYETRCMFAHGDHEMRTPEMNLRDGLITEEAIKAYQRVLNLRLRDASSSPSHHQQHAAAPPAYGAAAEASCCEEESHNDDDDDAPRLPRALMMTSTYTHNPYANVLPRRFGCSVSTASLSESGRASPASKSEQDLVLQP